MRSGRRSTDVRILYLADIRFPLERANGIQSMATCHALAARGHDVTMIVRPDTHTPPLDPFAFYGLPRIDRLRIEIAPLSGPPAARRAGYLTYAIGRSLGRARQELIFTRDLGLAALMLRLPASLRAPVVYEAHGIAADAAAALPELLSSAPPASAAKLRRLERRDARVWRGADAYVTITEGLARELSRRFGDRPRIAVVPDGVRLNRTDSTSDRGATTDRTTAKDDTDKKPFTIGYAGNLYPWKGVHLVIEAIAALTDTRGLIIGGHEREGDLARLRELVDQLDCTSRVTFTGRVAPVDVAPLLKQADVLTLPNPASAISTAFTSPLKLFEYMAAGRPIVASDLPSIREVLTDDHNALLVESGNPQALTAAIRRLRADPGIGERLARQALDDVRQYTWEQRAAKLESLFTQVVEAIA
jgi:glycosyltransferase involved in cell wall biosynthesis